MSTYMLTPHHGIHPGTAHGMTPGSTHGTDRHGAGAGISDGMTPGIHGAGAGDLRGAHPGDGDRRGDGDPVGADAGIQATDHHGTTAIGRITTQVSQELTVRRTAQVWPQQLAAVRVP